MRGVELKWVAIIDEVLDDDARAQLRWRECKVMLAPPGKLAVLAFEIHTSAIEDLLYSSLLCLTVLELEDSPHANQGGNQANCGRFVAGIIIKERSFAGEIDVK